MLSLVPSHHNHAIGEMIGIRLDVDHVIAFRTATRQYLAGSGPQVVQLPSRFRA